MSNGMANGAGMGGMGPVDGETQEPNFRVNIKITQGGNLEIYLYLPSAPKTVLGCAFDCAKELHIIKFPEDRDLSDVLELVDPSEREALCLAITSAIIENNKAKEICLGSLDNSHPSPSAQDGMHPS